MKKLIKTFLKDMKISFNGLYFYIEVGFAVIFVLVMLFVVPENFDQTQHFHIYTDLDEKDSSRIVEQFDLSGAHITMHDDMDSLKAAMSDDRSSLGFYIGMENSQPVYDIIFQGFETERTKSMFKTMLESRILTQMPGFEGGIETTVLEPRADTLTDREHILPIFLTMNVGFMGLFIIAAYIFLDKDEGVIKSFAVSPAKIWHYLASKLMIMLIIGISTSFFVILLLSGSYINYPLFTGAIIAFNLFGSTLGLLISSYFDTMSKAMGGLYFAVLLLVFPSISYFMPAFTPLWIKWFPSYPMLFSFREIMLRDGNHGYALRSILIFVLLSAILFAYSNLRFKKTLTV